MGREESFNYLLFLLMSRLSFALEYGIFYYKLVEVKYSFKKSIKERYFRYMENHLDHEMST